jgi:hypothetical protein
MDFYKLKSYISIQSRDGAFGVATGYGLGGQGVGVRAPGGSSRPALGPTQPLIQCFRGLFPRG